MKKIGTDILALVCVFGGGAVAGAATLAMMQGGEESHLACAVEATRVSPRIVVSSGGEARAIVVTPDVRVHQNHGCVVEVREDVRVRMEEVRREMERARTQVEEARRETERVRLHVQQEQWQEAQARLRAQLVDLDPLKLEMEGLALALESGLEPEVEARIQAKLHDLQEKLEKDLQEKLEKGKGGTMR